MIDRLVHHADVIALKGDSYRLKDKDLGRVPAAGRRTMTTRKTVSFHVSPADQISISVDRLLSTSVTTGRRYKGGLSRGGL
jgi:hypothetical protein